MNLYSCALQTILTQPGPGGFTCQSIVKWLNFDCKELEDDNEDDDESVMNIKTLCVTFADQKIYSKVPDPWF